MKMPSQKMLMLKIMLRKAIAVALTVDCLATTWQQHFHRLTMYCIVQLQRRVGFFIACRGCSSCYIQLSGLLCLWKCVRIVFSLALYLTWSNANLKMSVWDAPKVEKWGRRKISVARYKKLIFHIHRTQARSEFTHVSNWQLTNWRPCWTLMSRPCWNFISQQLEIDPCWQGYLI